MIRKSVERFSGKIMLQKSQLPALRDKIEVIGGFPAPAGRPI
jgi:hypothetical protein